ncbi:MAG: helix-turn-helix transcriptional regulator [Deltaproteobacteria bacterium]|nr:helix-turn-helix transcriptional regulator [Deltaproteobacteria bacterium]
MQIKEIRKWLIDKDLTQQDIAAKARVSGAYVTMIFKGERGQQKGPKFKRLIRVFKKLGCPQEFLEAANH